MDDITDYLSVSFSSTDYVGHIFGPSSLEAEDNLLRLDRTLAALFKSVDEQVGLENTLIVFSSDHGTPDVPGHLNKFGIDAGYFDIITARAVAPLKNLLEWARPLLKNNAQRKGYCLFSKGSRIEEEIKDVNSNDWQMTTTDLSKHLASKKQNLIIVTAVLTNT